MKILIIQIARFGDIYQTWPTLNALLRCNPDNEIHLLVREKFTAATDGLSPRVHIHKLPSSKILGPVIRDLNDLEISQLRMSQFAESLRAEEFDHIVNLSFSPLSSYLTHFLCRDDDVKVSGYSRHEDGYLALPDDSSAYFYAQVGIGRFNRYHLCDVFAAVAGVDLEDSDWRVPTAQVSSFQLSTQNRYLIAHLGTSQQSKTWPVEHWSVWANSILANSDLNLVLIGSFEEKQTAQEVCQNTLSFEDRIVNLVGETQISDLFPVIKGAELLVGGDSVSMHIASLVGTLCLNLSSTAVNFWETGPRTIGSRVLWNPRISDLGPDQVISETVSMMTGGEHSKNAIVRFSNDLIGYKWSQSEGTAFEWGLIEALYTGKPFPILDDQEVYAALLRMRELCTVAMKQIPLFREIDKRRQAHELLSQVEQVLEHIESMIPSVGPILRWFRTEKTRMGPMDLDQLIDHTYQVYEKMYLVTTIYVGAGQEIPNIGGVNANNHVVK